MSQPQEDNSTTHHWHPVVYYSHKITVAKYNYKVHDSELLVIVIVFKK